MAWRLFGKLMFLFVAVTAGIYLSHRHGTGWDRSGGRDEGHVTAVAFSLDEALSVDDVPHGQLVVVNFIVPGSGASRRLAGILDGLEADGDFDGRVVFRKFHATPDTAPGVIPDDFHGHLEFIARDRSFKPLRRVVDPDVVRESIRACLDALDRPSAGESRGGTRH